jgi:hypothetical protein
MIRGGSIAVALAVLLAAPILGQQPVIRAGPVGAGSPSFDGKATAGDAPE